MLALISVWIVTWSGGEEPEVRWGGSGVGGKFSEITSLGAQSNDANGDVAVSEVTLNSSL